MKKNTTVLVIIFFILAIPVTYLIYSHQETKLSDKSLRLWNEEQNYKKAALYFLENCERKDALSCQLTQLPKVQDQYSEAQVEKSNLLLSRIENDAVIEARVSIDDIIAVETFSQFLSHVPKINKIDFKFLQTHSLIALGLWSTLFDTKSNRNLETDDYKQFKLKVSNELILRNQTLGFYLKGSSLKSEGDFIEAVENFNECALRGNKMCILQNTLSYAAGVGRIQNLDESHAWFSICRMVGYSSCDEKIGSTLNRLKNRDNFNLQRSEELSKKYAQIVIKNLGILKKCSYSRNIYCNDFICDEVCMIDGISYGKRID